MRQEVSRNIDSLLKRVEEVRSLLSLPERDYSSFDEDSVLVQVGSELVEILERTHRKLIETNTERTVLRETAENMLSSVRPEEAIQTVCFYLHRVLGMGDVGLWLMDRESAVLEGRWSEEGEEGAESIQHSFSILEAEEPLKEALWGLRTVVLQHHEACSTLGLRAGNGGGSVIVVPLLSSRQGLPCKEVKRCIRRECSAYFGREKFCWGTPATLCFHEKGFEISRHEEFCARCDVFPLLGVLAARKGAGQEVSAGALATIESVAYNVSRVLENSRLYGDLRIGEEFRQSVLDSMGECLLAVDLEGRIVAFNRMTEILSGFSAEEVVGTRHDFLVPPGEAERWPIARTLKQGVELSSIDTHVSRRSGAAVPVRMTTRLLRSEDACVSGIIATFSDLRPSRKVEKKIRQLDRLAALGRFASSVAHELRNPLAGIAAGVQYMSRRFGEKGPEADNVRFILREIARLER
ncbi:MAG: PAS domain S-box protein, partial [Candidatus Eisenbacteria bacterium]